MATIEERAKMQARLLTCKNCTVCKFKAFISDLSEKICSLEGCEECEENYAAFHAYVLAAADKDRIARAEERERCEREAADALCEICRECDSFDFDDYCPKQKIIIDALRHDNTSIPGQ